MAGRRKKRSTSSYRAAALRGWKTRRKNLERRSEAAKKGWRTRRKNERRRRSDKTRAKKSGETVSKKRRRSDGVSALQNQEYIVTTIKTRSGREQKGKQVDLFVIYIAGSTDQEVIEFIVEWYTEINPESPDAWVLNLIARAQQIVVARGPKTSREWIVERRS